MKLFTLVLGYVGLANFIAVLISYYLLFTRDRMPAIFGPWLNVTLAIEAALLAGIYLKTPLLIGISVAWIACVTALLIASVNARPSRPFTILWAINMLVVSILANAGLWTVHFVFTT